jgi:hypothetical protein
MSFYGHDMYVIGGTGTQGILSESHLYSTIDQTWTKVNTLIPEFYTRTNACKANDLHFLILYGGLTGAGLNSDLWLFSLKNQTSELLSPTGDMPPPLTNLNCFIESEDDDTIFTVFGGTSYGSRTQSGIYRYSLKKDLWTLANSKDIYEFSLSGAAAAKTSNHLITAGGYIMGYSGSKSIFDFDLKTSQLKKIGELPHASLNGGFAYVGTTLYVLYGASVKGTKVIFESPHSDFFRIELNEDCESCDYPCSPGTYSVGGGKCELCPPGTYNEAFGASSCQKCPAGTFSSYYGVNSQYLCTPCPQNYFTDTEGSQHCKDCKHLSYCPIGSVTEKNAVFMMFNLKSVSVQPKKYHNQSNNSTLAVYLALIILASGLALLLFLLYRHYKRTFDITKLDIFRDSHNHFKGIPMTLKTTTFGAVFSVLFILCALCLASVALIAFMYENTEETKSLVPFEVLQEEADGFTGDIEVTFEAYSYLDDCSANHINANPSNIDYSSIETSAFKSDSNCVVKFSCKVCTLQTGAEISLNLDENRGYSSLLKVNVTASSSIPDEVSSLTQYLYSPDQEAFRGNTPSKFEFQATASVSSTQLFTSNLNNEASTTKTGYHITTSSLPIAGSSYNNYK